MHSAVDRYNGLADPTAGLARTRTAADQGERSRPELRRIRFVDAEETCAESPNACSAKRVDGLDLKAESARAIHLDRQHGPLDPQDRR